MLQRKRKEHKNKNECVTRRYSALPPYLNNNYLKVKIKMPKIKTNSGSKKMIRSYRKQVKVKRKHAFHSHILTKKTKNAKNETLYIQA